MTPATNVIYLADYKEMLVILEEENNKMFSFLTFIECYLSLVLYLMEGYIYIYIYMTESLPKTMEKTAHRKDLCFILNSRKWGNLMKNLLKK